MAVDTPARIAVLGAGPVGLEAALYGRFLGYDVDVYERGQVCEHLRGWGHLRMFTPASTNITALGAAAIQAQDPDWRPPADDALFTGSELLEAYFAPLAQTDLLADSINEYTEVIAVGRDGQQKQANVSSEERSEAAFRILIRHSEEERYDLPADIVIDTTGTYANPNGLGRGGMPAIGEIALRPEIEYGAPDVEGTQREAYQGHHTLVIGTSWPAAATTVALARLRSEDPATQITWVTEQGEAPPEGPIEVDTGDPLPERMRVALAANQAAFAGEVEHISASWVEAIRRSESGAKFTVKLVGTMETELQVDRIVAQVGYRPDLEITRELQMKCCYATEGPQPLAVELAGHGNTDQKSSSGERLVLPEPNFYVLGAKSYGRRTDFLLETGHMQIRDLLAMIVDRGELDLYANMRKMLAAG